MRSENVWELQFLESRTHLSVAGVKTVFDEQFSGRRLNEQVWHQPLFRPDGSTYLGRTQLRVSQNTSLPKPRRGVLKLKLSSYNPTMLPGLPSFYGTEIESNKVFVIKPTQAIDLVVIARLDQLTPGIVGGIFFYKVRSPSDHDEVDTELLGNQAASGANDAESNVYAREGFGAGSTQFHPLPMGGRLTGFHKYGMRCYSDRIEWRIDGKLVRIEHTIVPRGPFQVFLNIWAPDSNWSAAYSDQIQPVSSPSFNKNYSVSLDRVIVRKIKVRPPNNGGGGGEDDSLYYTEGATSGAEVGVPAITLTKVPKYASARGDLHGFVTNVNPVDYVVAVFTRVSGEWWTKPTFADRFVNIGADGIWQTNILSGGTDSYATDVAVFLVPNGTDVPTASAEDNLPDSLMSFTHLVFRRPMPKIDGEGTPEITFTHVPPINTSESLSGTVTHVSPSDYQIAIFINPYGWWTKPYWDYPGTHINLDGTWTSLIVTGGVDARASQIAVYLLPVDFVIPALGGSGSLPSSLDQYAVASHLIQR